MEEKKCLKNPRRNDSTLIINVIESIKDKKIDELSGNSDISSNDVNRIKKNKYNLKSILK